MGKNFQCIAEQIVFSTNFFSDNYYFSWFFDFIIWIRFAISHNFFAFFHRKPLVTVLAQRNSPHDSMCHASGGSNICERNSLNGGISSGFVCLVRFSYMKKVSKPQIPKMALFLSVMISTLHQYCAHPCTTRSHSVRQLDILTDSEGSGDGRDGFWDTLGGNQ